MTSTIHILFEDDYLAAIEKPPGIVVNNAENVTALTVQQWASQRWGSVNKGESAFVSRAGIVHRIDKETSGILLIAKRAEVFAALQSQFFERQTKKHYLALVHGTIVSKEGIIKAPVGRLPWDRRKFGVLPEGRDAQTSYRIKDVYKGDTQTYTFVDIEPLTGRTHQIRIHFKHLGHSLVSDPLYAGKHVYEHDLTFCPRLFLHASQLTFTHPVSSKEMTITSDLPLDLATALSKLSIISHS